MSMTMISQAVLTSEQVPATPADHQRDCIEALIQKIAPRIETPSDNVRMVMVKRRISLLTTITMRLATVKASEGSESGIGIDAEGTLWQFSDSRLVDRFDYQGHTLTELMLLHNHLICLDMRLFCRS